MKRAACLVYLFAAACSDSDAQPQRESITQTELPQQGKIEHASLLQDDLSEEIAGEPAARLSNLPEHTIWIECTGNSRYQNTMQNDLIKSKDDIKPVTTLFVIDDFSQKLYQYDTDDNMFVEFCGTCEKTFKQSIISWTEIIKDNSGFTSSYGIINRIEGYAEDESKTFFYENGVHTSTMTMTFKYPQCHKVDRATYNLNNRKF